MPLIRFLGNKVIDIICQKLTDCTNISDFTNGFFCIKASTLNKINLDLISKDFFFEIDILIALSNMNVQILNIPTYRSYKNNKSNLKIHKIIIPFFFKFLDKFLK